MDIRLIRAWRQDPGLFDAVRGLFTYAPGESRAAGYLYAAGEQPWPAAFAEAGGALLDDLDGQLGIRFTIALFQAYRDGAGCSWHTDDAFDVQAVLSLGVTRTFGIRSAGGEPEWLQVHHGDLLVMPSGFQAEHEHCVPDEDVPGERCSLVFRTVARR